MRILYISISYIPSRRANSVHVMKMCQAFAKLGHEVTIISKNTTSREEAGVVDDFAFYNVEPCFSIVKLPRPNAKGGGIVFYSLILGWLWQNRTEIDLVYGRDTIGSWLGTKLNLPGVVDLHDVPRHQINRVVTKKLSRSKNIYRFVFNCSALHDEYEALQLLSKQDNLVAHNGADEISNERLSSECEDYVRQYFSPNKIHVAYVGNLYKGKGAEIVLALADRIPDTIFHIIGGSENDLEKWSQFDKPANLVMHGFVAHERLGGLFKFVDIFLMPSQREIYGPSGSNHDYGRWTSPIKLFEYMAAGKPIISSDLPVLREVLEHGRNALLAPPDDVTAWETAVRRLQSEPGLAARLGQAARQDLIEKYTWQSRAEKVLQGL